MNYDKLVEYYYQRKKVAEKELQALREQLIEKQTQVNEFEQLTRKYCPHHETEIQVRRYEGGYYNVSITLRSVVCKKCGYVLERRDISGGYG